MASTIDQAHRHCDSSIHEAAPATFAVERIEVRSTTFAGADPGGWRSPLWRWWRRSCRQMRGQRNRAEQMVQQVGMGATDAPRPDVTACGPASISRARAAERDGGFLPG
jgi:hypothetical protein